MEDSDQVHRERKEVRLPLGSAQLGQALVMG